MVENESDSPPLFKLDRLENPPMLNLGEKDKTIKKTANVFLSLYSCFKCGCQPDYWFVWYHKLLAMLLSLITAYYDISKVSSNIYLSLVLLPPQEKGNFREILGSSHQLGILGKIQISNFQKDKTSVFGNLRLSLFFGKVRAALQRWIHTIFHQIMHYHCFSANIQDEDTGWFCKCPPLKYWTVNLGLAWLV